MRAVQSPKRRNEENSMWDDATAKPRELVQEYPATATMVAFGIGVGVGVLLGHTIGEAFHGQPAHHPWKVSQYGRDLSQYGRDLCETVKNAVGDALQGHLPR
jgi:hypothetical protein